MNRTARTLAAAGAALTATAALVPAPAAQAATRPAARCSVSWGSLPKTANVNPIRYGAALGPARTGHHACYDRIVFDVPGTVGSVAVGYVDDGGRTSPKVLAVITKHRSPGTSIANAALKVTGLPTIVGTDAGAEWTTTEYGRAAITRARLPFRVFTLKGPGSTNRVVVDVAHRW